MRRTKIVCTIGPAACSYDQLLKLADTGMDVARLNMSHGDYDWHRKVIKAVKSINEKGEHSIAILLDTKGPEVRTGDLKEAIDLHPGDKFTFTVRSQPEYEDYTTEINYDDFINDVSVDDIILIDGGMISMKVVEKTDLDVICECVEGGNMGSRRHVHIKGKSAQLPSITEKDWEDIHFGMDEGVDFIALSFVKNANVIHELHKEIEKKEASIDVIAKVESIDAVENLQEILDAADGAMVARGDLGAEVPVAEVPLIQERMVEICREQGKPVIVATNMLESMIVHPTPTRAEVTDITFAVMQGSDAIMLSGETAAGKYPFKALDMMSSVAERIEHELKEHKVVLPPSSDEPKPEMANSAAAIASHLDASAILVFTRRGYMAALLSRCRPHTSIYAFTNMSNVRRKLNLSWGVDPYRIQFSSDPEKTIQRALTLMKERGKLKDDDRVIVVSDILAGDQMVETIQVRTA